VGHGPGHRAVHLGHPDQCPGCEAVCDVAKLVRVFVEARNDGPIDLDHQLADRRVFGFPGVADQHDAEMMEPRRILAPR
jgi:hypothetical protein